jgi:asparagine N-glycosylation enzyme membrane subunit Stt3
MDRDEFMDFVKDRRVQWAATVIVLFVILFMSSSIRLSNWDLLTDQTTGEKIPLALDPFYFLRVSETLVENGGELPAFDMMRIPGFDVGWSSEVMPQVVVKLWEMSNVFGDYTLREVIIFSPVLFYAVGLILFFFLVYVLTKSKFAGVLASAFLAFAPSYLYRTMAGFSDHEAIGMIGFFAAILTLSLSFRYLDKIKENGYIGAGVAGLLVGFATALTVAAWKGVAVFVFMIVPIAFLFLWFVKMQNKKNVFGNVGIVYYVCWMVFSVFFSSIFGMRAMDAVSRFILSSTGIIGVTVLGFVVLDRLFIYFEGKIKMESYNEKYRMTYVAVLLLILGFLVLPLLGKNLFGLLWEVLNRLLNPLWGSSRLEATVAENAQPYLTSWISTAGKSMFFLFVTGMVLMGVEFSKGIRSRKRKVLLILGFVAMVFGILFSRISPSSIFNGSGIFSLSGGAYLGGLAFFTYAFFKVLSKEKLGMDSSILVLFAWMLTVLVTGRSTTRLFFAIAPFMCLAAAFGIVNLFRYYRRGGLDETVKMSVVILLAVFLILSIMIINSSHNDISGQARMTGPSTNIQWQSAMAWVRNNTAENSVFSHWWDYGYWVQSLGE